jgi:outer membrane murein-binding lipoprotein Lpp
MRATGGLAFGLIVIAAGCGGPERKEIAGLDKRMGKVESDVRALKDADEQLARWIEQVEEGLKGARADADSRTQARYLDLVRKIEAEMGEQQKTHQELNARITQLQSDLAAIQSRSIEADRRIEAVNKDIQDQLGVLEKKIREQTAPRPAPPPPPPPPGEKK